MAGGAWGQRRIADAAALLTWLLAKGGQRGFYCTRSDMAFAMGWDIGRVDTIIRFLREHPELGYAISIRRGPDPWVVVSTPKDTIQGSAITDMSRIAYDSMLIYLWQIGRAVATEFVHAGNMALNSKGTKERKAALKIRNEHRKALVAIQLLLQPHKRPHEAELDTFINEVLSV